MKIVSCIVALSLFRRIMAMKISNKYKSVENVQQKQFFYYNFLNANHNIITKMTQFHCAHTFLENDGNIFLSQCTIRQ